MIEQNMTPSSTFLVFNESFPTQYFHNVAPRPVARMLAHLLELLICLPGHSILTLYNFNCYRFCYLTLI